MRHRGRLTDWKDDRGFGFITPAYGGGQVFVHIKSFASRRRRPAGGELLTYELHHDADGRARAEAVKFLGDSSESGGSPQLGYRLRGTWPAVLFLAGLGGAVYAGLLPSIVPAVYLLASVLTFLFYAIDKHAAQEGSWRTPESNLHFLALVGGWPGAVFAQSLLRHKTKKESFRAVFWVTVLLNCGALAWLLLTPEGAEILRDVTDIIQSQVEDQSPNADDLDWL